MASVLLATGDAALLDVLLRLAAAADVEATVAGDVDRGRAAWADADLVCVGEDLADDLAGADPPRRAAVVLVTTADRADAYRRAVDIGAQDVAILPDAETWLVDRMTAAAEPDEAPATTVGVVGGRGGAGASVLSAVLAVTGTRRGWRGFLIDADPLGGGIDLVLGQEHTPGARWPELAARSGRLNGAALRAALPAVDRLAVLSWQRGGAGDIPVAAMRSVLRAAGHGSDLVVVDLPRHRDAAGTEALLACDVVLVVVPAEVRATVAADQIITDARRHVPDIRLAVRGPAPGGLRPEVIAQSLGVPLAGWIPADKRLAIALEGAEPGAIASRGPLADFCADFLDELSVTASRAAA
jgi:secretion/DNA translocation related CpaE-like protein